MAEKVAKTQEVAQAPARTVVYRPLADIIETEQGVSIMLEMPGVTNDEVEISLERRVLTIQGSAGSKVLDDLHLAHAEYGDGGYERAFTLNEDFDPDRIEAEMRNGVLTITLPRAEAKQPKKIAVKAA